MAQLIQMDFWKTPEQCEHEYLIKRLDTIEKDLFSRLDRQRKSQFAKIGEVKKEVLEIKEDLALLKGYICKGSI
jgi:hypothetical protein